MLFTFYTIWEASYYETNSLIDCINCVLCTNSGLLPQMTNCIKIYTSDSMHVHSRYYNHLNQLTFLTLNYITNALGMIIKYKPTSFFRGFVTWMQCYVLDN